MRSAHVDGGAVDRQHVAGASDDRGGAGCGKREPGAVRGVGVFSRIGARAAVLRPTLRSLRAKAGHSGRARDFRAGMRSLDFRNLLFHDAGGPGAARARCCRASDRDGGDGAGSLCRGRDGEGPVPGDGAFPAGADSGAGDWPGDVAGGVLAMDFRPVAVRRADWLDVADLSPAGDTSAGTSPPVFDRHDRKRGS